MAWLSPQRRWALFNLAALAIFIYVWTQGSRDWNNAETTFDPMLESGKWAIRFLLLSLAMTPLQTYLRWSSALKLRKAAGLWAFGFGLAHFALYAYESYEPVQANQAGALLWHWLTWPMQLYIMLGLGGLLVLGALAATSNKWSMRRLGKNWKRLHRCVYGAGVAVAVHALLATEMSKKVLVRDPNAQPELRVYLGLLALLLLIRVPQVRALLLGIATRPRPQVVAVVAPKTQPTYVPAPQITISLPAAPHTIGDDATPTKQPGELFSVPNRTVEPQEPEQGALEKVF